MKTVILCGGEGVRFRNNVLDVPKVLALIGNRPILWHILKYYRSFGHREFILCLGNNADEIRAFIDNTEEDWEVTAVDTGLNTPTGGRVKKIESYIDSDNFFVNYGDGLADVDLARLLNFHLGHGKTATLTAVRPFSQYGLMSLDGSDQVVNFEEKPRMTKYVNGGFFVFRRSIFNYLNEDEPIETSLFTKLVHERELMAFRHEGFWKSMDTFKENVELNQMWQGKAARWVRW